MNRPNVKTSAPSRQKRDRAPLPKTRGIALAAVLLVLLVITLIGTVSLQ